jgi:hypothetical protein
MNLIWSCVLFVAIIILGKFRVIIKCLISVSFEFFVSEM